MPAATARDVPPTCFSARASVSLPSFFRVYSQKMTTFGSGRRGAFDMLDKDYPDVMFMAADRGMPLNRNGVYNDYGFVERMKELGVRPKDSNFLAELDESGRQIDNLDLREQYNGRRVPLDLQQLITSAKDHNALNDFLYKVGNL